MGTVLSCRIANNYSKTIWVKYDVEKKYVKMEEYAIEGQVGVAGIELSAGASTSETYNWDKIETKFTPVCPGGFIEPSIDRKDGKVMFVTIIREDDFIICNSLSIKHKNLVVTKDAQLRKADKKRPLKMHEKYDGIPMSMSCVSHCRIQEARENKAGKPNEISFQKVDSKSKSKSNEELKQQVSEAQEKLTSKTNEENAKEIDELKSHLNKFNKSNEELKQQFSEAQEKLTSKTNEENAKEIDELKSNSNKLNKSYDELKQQFSEAQEKLTSKEVPFPIALKSMGGKTDQADPSLALDSKLDKIMLGSQAYGASVSSNDSDLHSLDWKHSPEKLLESITPSELANYIRKAGRSSTKIKHFIEWLQAVIKNSLNGVQKLWVGYEPNNNEPVFVAMVNELKDDFPTQIWNFKVIQRVNGQVSDEAKIVLMKEKETNLTFSAEEQSSIRMCLAKYSTKLMRDHSNLTVASASKIKSSNHGSKSALYKETMCIVLCVDLKGVVPIHEELLPTQLDGIPVDVREGTFKTYGKKPTEYHKNLMMGCQIVTDYKTCGTLGGFVQMENNEIACLTCCHVFETKESVSDFKKDPNNFTFLKKSVYQPCPGDLYTMGQLVKWLKDPGNETNIGIDAALIKISNPQRYPQSGHFPDAESYLTGFSPENPMRFDSGEVIKCIDEVPIPSTVVKYGASTGHTIGSVRLFGAAVHPHTTSFIAEQDRVQLHQQLEVLSNSLVPFAGEGDSGSLVFLFSDLNIRALGLLVGRTDYGTTIVTPIWAVLNRLGLPLQLLNFESEPCPLPSRKSSLSLSEFVKDVENLKSNVTDLAHQTDQKMKIIETKIDKVGDNQEKQHTELISFLTKIHNSR